MYRIEEIRNAFRDLLSEIYQVDINNTRVILTHGLLAELNTDGEPPVDGLAICEVAPDRSFLCYWVVLDTRFLTTDVWRNTFARWRALKTIFLHEICHTLLKHPGHILRNADATEQDGNPLLPPDVVKTEEDKSRDHQREDDDCDLLSYVLAFWPFQRFKGLLLNEIRQANMSIRLNIANVYKMPVNAVAQWIVITMYNPAQYWLHYAWLSANANKDRRSVDPGEILDYFDCKDVIESLDPDEAEKLKTLPGAIVEEYAAKQLFLRDTSARSALLSGRDSSIRRYRSSGCICLAFYDEQNFLYNRKSDEVVVLGLTRRDPH